MGTTREASKVTTVFETVSVCGARVPVPLVAKAPEAPPTAQSVVLNWPVILRVSSLCHAPASSMLPPVQLRKGGRQMEKTHNTEGLGSENISMFFSNSIANKKGFLPRPARFRAWTGRSREAGSWATDQMRAITGVGAEGLTDAAAHITGAFFSSYAVKVGGFVGATETSAVYACANAFDSSRVVPTGPVTVPPHVWQPIILYLGLPA